jgi:hypothetical protein
MPDLHLCARGAPRTERHFGALGMTRGVVDRRPRLAPFAQGLVRAPDVPIWRVPPRSSGGVRCARSVRVPRRWGRQLCNLLGDFKRCRRRRTYVRGPRLPESCGSPCRRFGTGSAPPASSETRAGPFGLRGLRLPGPRRRRRGRHTATCGKDGIGGTPLWLVLLIWLKALLCRPITSVYFCALRRAARGGAPCHPCSSRRRGSESTTTRMSPT